MSDEVYRRLAQQLDALPNGFPATESGVELRVLAKLFTPEEADLAAQLKLRAETAEEIAARLGRDVQATLPMLKAMARHGAIRAERDERGLRFGLAPFMIGIYESSLPTMDAEFAKLFEEYYEQAMGSAIAIQPAFHRVVPVEQSIQVDTEVLPYERASQILEQAQDWGVQDCICRKQQKLLGKGCEHAVEACMVFGPLPGSLAGRPGTRRLTKEEAYDLLRQTEEAGLVHTVGNRQKDLNYICNCCTCGCAILRALATFGQAGAAHSDFRSVVDEKACAGCELCVERCQFGALTVTDGVCRVNAFKCFGCGLCVASCPDGALSLVRKPAEEMAAPPVTGRDWGVARAAARHVDLGKVL
jgi:Na+-translocating ferredoxin:NAD+ oxidoreductase subunit B